MASTASAQPPVRMTGGQQGQIVCPAQQVDAPVLGPPLLNEPVQTNPAATIDTLGPLQYLLGTWTNRNLGSSGLGGPENPFSYNLMVLPQVDPTSPHGYILKSMPYYEEITFTAMHGTAANRGGMGTQVSNAILYEQRVYISAGPAEDMLVHFENGIWSNLTDMEQALGPYGDGNGPALGCQTVTNSVAPTQDFQLFKQISVPHGNSVLACGNFTSGTGAPVIDAPPQVLPSGIDTSLYTEPGYIGNLNPKYAQNPNLPLAEALAHNPVSRYFKLEVNSHIGGGAVTNIGFEQMHCDVTQYYATYWIEAVGGETDYTQLQYSQTILLQIPIVGADGTTTKVIFPHITTNTLTRTA